MGHLFRPAVGTRIGFSHSLSSFVIVGGVPNKDWRAVAWSPALGLFCAVGQDIAAGDAVMTSPDGINWTQQTTPAVNVIQAWRSIVWADALGLFVAVGIGGDKIMTSPDGINWTPQTPAVANSFTGIAWSPELGLLCGVTNNGAATTNVQTSPDGINWTLQVDASGGLTQWAAIAWAPELTTFVAVSTTGAAGPGGGLERVQSSINGINWTIREIPALPGNPVLSSVAWSPKLNLFAAIDFANGTTDAIRTSPDGISWTARQTPIALGGGGGAPGQIVWSPEQEMFAAAFASNDVAKRVLTSVDGINWFLNISNLNTVTDNNWTGLAWSASLDLFAMVAQNSGSTNFAGTLVAP